MQSIEDQNKDVADEIVEANPPGQPKKEYKSIFDIPPYTLFTFEKSGTPYIKMPNGSIRNTDKAVRKQLGLTKKQTRRKKGQ
jgi:hypothetical protein